MYHQYVRSKVRSMFSSLSQGDYEPALESLGSSFEHSFAGENSLGGKRHTKDSLRRWFIRLYSLSPKLNFTIKDMSVSGFPWNTAVFVEWNDTATLADGSSYTNNGVHILKIRWGKVVIIHAYLDTALLVQAYEKLAKEGFAEAIASPIND